MHPQSVRGFDYEASNAAVYKFHTSTTSFGFGDPDFLYGTDILAIGDIYHVTLTFTI